MPLACFAASVVNGPRGLGGYRQARSHPATCHVSVFTGVVETPLKDQQGLIDSSYQTVI